MKTCQRLLALLLCAAMLLSLFGCQTQGEEPETTVQTGETETTETVPSLLDTYRAAAEALKAASGVTIQVSAVKTTTVAGENFTEGSKQTLYCSGLDTDAPRYHLEENVICSTALSLSFDEICADGTIYLTVDDENRFSGTYADGELEGRYLPTVILEPELYGDITEEGSTLTFSQPTAPESWAVPEGAELIEASGTAVMGDDGSLEKSTYTITYSYGSAKIAMEVEASVTAGDVAIEVPGDPEAYIPLDCVDAPRLCEMAVGYLFQAGTYSSYSLASVYCSAAGFLQNYSDSVDTYYLNREYIAKITDSYYTMDYSTGQSYEGEYEVTFIDGVYSYSEDGGEAEEVPGVSAATIRAHYDSLRGENIMTLDVWQNAAVTDLGSLYLVELTLTEETGYGFEDDICEFLWNDADFLDNLASEYVNTEVTAYVGIDKYTGLPTSAGYYFEGAHTLDGYSYPIIWQLDQSFSAPSLGAYKEITGEMAPEEEPEVPATPLFYHVTGADGQEMWLFGTIHIGDNRTAYLPQEIYDALAASDALAIECDTEGFDEQYEEDEEIQEAVSDAYYHSDGTSIQDHIDPELYEIALKYMKATGCYNMNADYLKPSIWSSCIDNFFAYQGFQLTSDQGVEERLTKFAEDNGIELREVESSLFQIQMMTGYSGELQETLLENSISYTGESYWKSSMELYELWCAGDEAALMERLSDEVDTSEMTEEELAEYEEYQHLLEEYNQAMSYDRNDGMLEVLKGYLESGETVFVAVGLAHLLNDVNGLVFTLREAGYTVELVTFASAE